MRFRLALLLVLSGCAQPPRPAPLHVPRRAALPPGPEDLVPSDACLCVRVDSVPALRDALAASGVYAGALDGSWKDGASGLLAVTGVDPEASRTVLWELLEAFEPLVEGPAAAALTAQGPLLVLKPRDGAALREARARGLRAEMDGAWLTLSRRRVQRTPAPLSASPLYLRARASAPGPVFLYADPGALARSGRLGARMRALPEPAPFAEALAWSCAFGPDGVTDTLRLLRPGRRPLLPAASPPRLASALPPQAAARITGRISLGRLRELLACLLGKDWIGREALLAEASGWEGEVAASFGWSLVFPDVLLGFESRDPGAAVDRILREARERGATVRDGIVSLPDQTLPWTLKAGDGAVWIGTMPGSVAAAARAGPPGDAAPQGLRASLRFPEAFGPAASLLSALQQPGGPPIGKLLSARGRFVLSVDEDGEGTVLKARSPCGLLPALAAAGLGMQALSVHEVVEPPLAVTDGVMKALPGVRGLAFLETLEIRVVTPEETHALFAKEFEKELPPEKMARMEETMRAFGLLEPGQDLGRILNGALVDLVGGFYDPEKKALFLISGMPAQRIVAAHEMTHALQDQHFRIGEMQKALGEGDSDRSAALLALIEGDASVAMLEAFAAETEGNPGPALRMLLEVLASPGMVVGQLDALQAMPDAFLYQTMFSYEQGADFVREVRELKGWKGVDAMFKDPPVSTEQVLHPRKYLKQARDLPVKVEAAAAPEGWTPLNEDTMGEAGIRGYFRHWLSDREAERAGEGWGGDRFSLFSKGKERLLVWRTAWDSEKEAGEFAEALAKAQERRYGKGGGRTRIAVKGAEVELRDGPP